MPSDTVRGNVTQTGTPSARSASTTSRRFSSMLATTKSGASARIRARSGSFSRPTFGVRATWSRGSVQKIVTPAIRSSSPRAKRSSVMLGMSDTMR